MPTRPSRGLATTRQHAGFLTWPLGDLHRLAPIQIGSPWFLRPTPRSAVTRPAHPCGSTDAVGGPELATWPPRSWARRRFASGVSAPSAIRSMQRSGFPRRCTFRLRRRRSTSTNTSNVGTDSTNSSILAHPCRAGARQSRHPPCDEKRNAGALAGHRVLVLHGCPCGANGACATPVPRECEPRSSRPPCDDRSFARADGTEKRNSTRRRIEPRLEHRRAPFVTGDAVTVGWRIATTSARHRPRPTDECGPREGPHCRRTGVPHVIVRSSAGRTTLSRRSDP